MVGSASVDYLMYSGYLCLAYYWAMMAETAYQKLEKGEGDLAFYKAKIQTAEFYFDKLLPRTSGHAEAMVAPSESMTAMDIEHFSFLD